MPPPRPRRSAAAISLLGATALSMAGCGGGGGDQAGTAPSPTSATTQAAATTAGAPTETPARLAIFDDALRVTGPLATPTAARAAAWRARPGAARDQATSQGLPRGLVLLSETGVTSAGRLMTGSMARYRVYRNAPALTSADLAAAGAAAEIPGEPATMVTLSFTPAGARRFRALTRAIARRGALTGRVQAMVISVDGRVVSNPTIDYTQYPDGLAGSAGVQIQGGFTAAQAADLAARLTPTG